MIRDKRYNTVKNLILGGYLKTFREVFDTIPKSTIAADLGINGTRMNRLMFDVGRFLTKDLFRLAELIDVPYVKVMELVCNQHIIDSKGKKQPEPRRKKKAVKKVAKKKR